MGSVRQTDQILFIMIGNLCFASPSIVPNNVQKGSGPYNVRSDSSREYSKLCGVRGGSTSSLSMRMCACGVCVRAANVYFSHRIDSLINRCVRVWAWATRTSRAQALALALGRCMEPVWELSAEARHVIVAVDVVQRPLGAMCPLRTSFFPWDAHRPLRSHPSSEPRHRCFVQQHIAHVR